MVKASQKPTDEQLFCCRNAIHSWSLTFSASFDGILVYILNRHSVLVFITDENSKNLQDWNIWFTKICFAIIISYFVGPFSQALEKSVWFFHFSAAEALHKSTDAPGVYWKLAWFLVWFKPSTDCHCSQMSSPGCRFQVLSFLAETTLQLPVILTMSSEPEKRLCAADKSETRRYLWLPPSLFVSKYTKTEKKTNTPQ